MTQQEQSSGTPGVSRADRIDRVLDYGLQGVMCALVLLPGLANAAAGTNETFGGITEFLKSIAHLLIFEWGYYIGIITLAIQGYRWKTGRIDLMQLGGWGLGIGIVLFAPSIVRDLRNRAGTQL